MWFKNLYLYRLPQNWSMTAAALEEYLQRKVFSPCGSQEQVSNGWRPPAAHDERLVYSQNGQWLLALGTDERLLPTTVVRQEVAGRADVLAGRQGFRPGKKQLRDLHDEVVRDFLPRAFTRQSRILLWIDPQQGWLAIDSGSQPRAEGVLEALYDCVPGLPLKALRPQRSPVSLMTQWLNDDAAAAPFSLDSGCQLRAANEEKSTVSYVRHALPAEEIRAHLAAGKLPVHLSLCFDDRLTFVLTDKLAIRRLAFLDVVQEEVDSSAQEDAAAVFDSQFVLMGAELRRFLPALLDALGGEAQSEGSDSDHIQGRKQP